MVSLKIKCLLGSALMLGVLASKAETCPKLSDLNFEFSSAFEFNEPGDKETNDCYDAGFGDPEKGCFDAFDMGAKDSNNKEWLLSAYTYADSDTTALSQIDNATTIILNENREPTEDFEMCEYNVNNQVGIFYFPVDEKTAKLAQYAKYQKIASHYKHK